MKGTFISFEGIDGAGKSTHVPWCVAWLQERGLHVTHVREPGGTALGESLRQLLLTQPMTHLAETLLMFASRHQLIDEVIAPALARGDWVVSDRFVDASFAYQGGGRGVPAETLTWLQQTCVYPTMPQCTFWFDAPLAVAQSRRAQGRTAINGVEDRFEQEQQSFFANVHAGYQARWQAEPERIMRLDSTQSIDDLRTLMAARLTTLIAS